MIETLLLEMFNTEVVPNTLRKLLARMPWCKAVMGKVMEKERVMAPPEAVLIYMKDIREAIKGIPAPMIFNCDETGFESWSDAMNHVVIVPNTYEGQTIPIPIERKDKRSSAIVTIAADGTLLKLVIVIGRKTYEAELKQVGIRDTNSIIVSNGSGFVKGASFEPWAHEVFCPYVEQRRKDLGYSGPAFLIMDGCSSHFSDLLWDEFSFRGIVAVLLPPHTSDQIQPLDLVVFGLTKRRFNLIKAPEGLTVQSAQIYKMVLSILDACKPMNVIGSFARAGILFDYDEGLGEMIARVDVDRADKVRGFSKQRVRPRSFDRGETGDPEENEGVDNE
jgi:hypothetical protein